MLSTSIFSNWEPVIGTGEKCLPGEADKCGDGGRAIDARLVYPKGWYFQETPLHSTRFVDFVE